MTTYTVQKEDVGKTESNPVTETCFQCHNQRKEYPFEPLGRVITKDVGKMCKKIDNIWYVENQEQFNKRINN